MTKGQSSIGFFSKGKLSFGNYKIEYDNIPGTQEDKTSDARVYVNYDYFVIDNLAIGASFGYNNNVQRSDDNDIKFTSTNISFGPEIIWHPFDTKLNRFFLQAFGSFGGGSNKTEFAGSTTTYKSSTSGFGGGVGYDHVFSRHLSLTTSLGYQRITEKDKSTDDKERVQGVYIASGIRWFF